MFHVLRIRNGASESVEDDLAGRVCFHLPGATFHFEDDGRERDHAAPDLAVTLHPGSGCAATARRGIEGDAAGVVTNAQEAVIDGVVRNSEKGDLDAPDLFLANEIAAADVEAIVVVDVFADGEHGVGGGGGRGRLHQLHVAVGAGEVVGIHGTQAAIV